MPAFKSLAQADVAGKRVLLRADLNVPMKDGQVTDATRIERAAPTVRELADKGASQFKPIYGDELPLWDKVRTIAREVYRSDDIVADKAACLAGTDAYCTTPPRFWFDLALSLKNDKAEAYFISCANIHSIDVIADLEKALLRPVVTSNQAALWCALRTLGLKDVVSGLGALFSR